MKPRGELEFHRGLQKGPTPRSIPLKTERPDPKTRPRSHIPTTNHPTGRKKYTPLTDARQGVVLNPMSDIRGVPYVEGETEDRLIDAGYKSIPDYLKHIAATGNQPFRWFELWLESQKRLLRSTTRQGNSSSKA